MQIEYLSDNPAMVDIVAQWIYDEFVNGIRPGRSYEQVLAVMGTHCRTSLPIRLVAVIGGVCVGTVSVVSNDLKFSDYTPWLAALYVDKAHRGKKIAEQLIERVKEIVAGLGYNEVYLRTEHAGNYYKKRGWQYVETCTDEYNLNPDVFKFPLVGNC